MYKQIKIYDSADKYVAGIGEVRGKESTLSYMATVARDLNGMFASLNLKMVAKVEEVEY